MLTSALLRNYEGKKVQFVHQMPGFALFRRLQSEELFQSNENGNARF
jgi:hypothetical protein